MIVTYNIANTQRFLNEYRARGESVAFVPTMGNLHQGHLSLVEQAKQTCDRVVVSIFVNPLQFGPNEDFDAYPRTFEQDKQQLQALDVDLLFNPAVTEIYPQGQEAHCRVIAPEAITRQLCGASRPTHFQGVTTVVNKLFNIVAPDVAVFGKKDYQQLMLIRKMVSDLCMPVKVIGAEIARDKQGLALSSRNGYLSFDEKLTAATLREVILSSAEAIQSASQSFASIEQTAQKKLAAAGFKVDYFSVVRQADLMPATPDDQALLIAAAAWLGKPRLIDNLEVNL